jgi:hypothetical protein
VMTDDTSDKDGSYHPQLEAFRRFSNFAFFRARYATLYTRAGGFFGGGAQAAVTSPELGMSRRLAFIGVRRVTVALDESLRTLLLCPIEYIYIYRESRALGQLERFDYGGKHVSLLFAPFGPRLLKVCIISPVHSERTDGLPVTRRICSRRPNAVRAQSMVRGNVQRT